MQLEEEILSVSRRLTYIQHSSADDIFVQQYGRNPRYVQRYPREVNTKGIHNQMVAVLPTHLFLLAKRLKKASDETNVINAVPHGAQAIDSKLDPSRTRCGSE